MTARVGLQSVVAEEGEVKSLLTYGAFINTDDRSLYCELVT